MRNRQRTLPLAPNLNFSIACIRFTVLTPRNTALTPRLLPVRRLPVRRPRRFLLLGLLLRLLLLLVRRGRGLAFEGVGFLVEGLGVVEELRAVLVLGDRQRQPPCAGGRCAPLLGLRLQL